MPKLTQTFHLDITPEKYISNCSISELYETELLLSKEFRNRKMGSDHHNQILVIEHNAEMSLKEALQLFLDHIKSCNLGISNEVQERMKKIINQIYE